jgi:ubiquinone/menaquinone biosynthesis C-methylase UbiE
MDHEEVGQYWNANADAWAKLTRAGLDNAYHVASAVDLPFADATFDFARAFMSFMDITETDRVLAEVRRVLKPCGFLQFSISHPCFDENVERGERVLDLYGHSAREARAVAARPPRGR